MAFTNQNFTKFIGGDIEFVDVDQDGWLDVAVSGTSPDGRKSIAQEALVENKALRGIVKRQIMQQAWRKQAKELVLAELTRQGVASRGLINQIEKLAGKGTVLTEQEQALLRESLLGELGDQSGLIIVQGNDQQIPYPEIGESNEGEHSKVGLNKNLTQYAAAIAYDFAKGNFKKCAKHYSEILLLRTPLPSIVVFF